MYAIWGSSSDIAKGRHMTRNADRQLGQHSPLNRRQMLGGALAGVTSTLATPMPAWAQAYPNKPVRFVVPYPPGGGTDVIARIVQEPLAAAMGTGVIIDNRGGAGGSIGSDIAAKSGADGYTLLFTLSSHTINPGLFPKLGFDTEKDFSGISMVASLPQILVANPAFPAKDLKELIALAKDKPETFNYGSVGNGSPGHIAGALLDLKAGTRMQHIPYRGGGPAVTDVMGGQIPLLWVSIPAVAQHVKSGRLKALAVSTLKRSAVFPDVPTVVESGIADFEVDSWYAMFAPAGTPREIVDRWQKAVATVLKQPDVREKLLAQGAEGVGSTPEQLDKIVKDEIVKWRDVISRANIKSD
jgi:tripartite-type tricarboxylate transporter receptor subunit TctC